MFHFDRHFHDCDEMQRCEHVWNKEKTIEYQITSTDFFSQNNWKNLFIRVDEGSFDLISA